MVPKPTNASFRPMCFAVSTSKGKAIVEVVRSSDQMLLICDWALAYGRTRRIATKPVGAFTQKTRIVSSGRRSKRNGRTVTQRCKLICSESHQRCQARRVVLLLP